MGRRGRPAKVKTVPRKPSVSCSSRESSSSLVRYLYQSSRGNAVSSTSVEGTNLTRVGLSWVSILKSTPGQGGLASAQGGVSSAQDGVPSTLAWSSGTVPLKLGIVPLISSSTPISPVVVGHSSHPRAKISKEDIVDKVKYWENDVVCYVSSANPLSMRLKGLFVGFGRTFLLTR